MSELPDFLMASETEPGFVDERCPHCNARMYQDGKGAPVCLNACRLPGYLYRMLQNPVALDEHFTTTGENAHE